MSSVDGGGTVTVHEPPQYSDPATAGVITTQHPSLLETQPSGELQTGAPGPSRPRLTNIQSVLGYFYTDSPCAYFCQRLSALFGQDNTDWSV